MYVREPIGTARSVSVSGAEFTIMIGSDVENCPTPNCNLQLPFEWSDRRRQMRRLFVIRINQMSLSLVCLRIAARI
jgi:hypothetical protein